MKRYFAYIRVSTVKQGERGSSLTEQRGAIEAFAQHHELKIIEWFEEKETAAKQGRRLFTRMLGELGKGRAEGLIVHKIDRSARNLRDWANLGDLIDRGIDVQFVHDSVDLHSRGGRLSADIQAVVASDYIRNLRDEVKKGFYGRLKQGFYPLGAPMGYLDQGSAKAKTIDPIKGPLVRHAFERYATGTVSLRALGDELHGLGLRARDGMPLRRATLAKVLRNPFYTGVIRIERTNETFAGVHQPLISRALFDRVDATLHGKAAARVVRHDFAFSKLLRCAHCGYHLTGELQKGRLVYYRCHTFRCPGASVREEAVAALVRDALSALCCPEDEIDDIRDIIRSMTRDADADADRQREAARLQLARCNNRLQRLTDAFVDGLIDKELFTLRKDAVLRDRIALKELLGGSQEICSLTDRVAQYFEREISVNSGYENALPAERREILRAITSNLSVSGRNPAITLQSPFAELVAWRKTPHGGPYRATLRTARGRAETHVEILRLAAQRVLDEQVNGNRADAIASDEVPQIMRRAA